MKFTTTIECELPDTIEICGKKANLTFGDKICEYGMLSDLGDELSVIITEDFSIKCVFNRDGDTYVAYYATKCHPAELMPTMEHVGGFLTHHYKEFVNTGDCYYFTKVDKTE